MKMEKGNRLIINADDFGYSQERDQGIIECFQLSAISSASLMVNGIYASKAAHLATKENLPLGLHLNLTEGLPVGEGVYKTLVNRDGVLRGKFGLREELQAGRVDLNEVSREIICQVDRFHELMGCLPYHVDGHQHIHVYPGICEVFAEVLENKGISVTRLPIERCLHDCDWIDSNRLTFYQEVVKQSQLCNSIFLKHSLSFAPAFVGLSTCGQDMSVDRLTRALDTAFTPHSPSLPPTPDGLASAGISLKDTATSQPIKVCELMVHPGYPTGDSGGCGTGPDEFSKSGDRQYEMDVLKSADFQKYLQENDIALCSFEDAMTSSPSS